MYEILDFDANFKAYLDKWIALNKGKFKTYEQMEDAVPDVYLKWLNSPAAFLGGAAPGTFFGAYSNASELVKWMRLYEEAEVPVPDQLLDRISDLGKESLKPLVYTAAHDDYSPSVRMLAINLLKEIETGEETVNLCLRLIDARQEDDEIADAASELLRPRVSECTDKLISRLDEVNPSAREAYLDLLAGQSTDDRVFTALLEAFEQEMDKTALYASLLAKQGDERALSALKDAAANRVINYLDYLELRNAIEKLGGECPQREFDGDEYYEALKGGA
ncbi:MAG: hypothetical protein K5663_09075 [Clostridiales bacterium]|nr:hypothetical protein [Clostridiales bacterium]